MTPSPPAQGQNKSQLGLQRHGHIQLQKCALVPILTTNEHDMAAVAWQTQTRRQVACQWHEICCR